MRVGARVAWGLAMLSVAFGLGAIVVAVLSGHPSNDLIDGHRQRIQATVDHRFNRASLWLRPPAPR